MGPLENNENITKFEILREVQNGLQRLAERIERLAERLDRLSEPDAAKESSKRDAAKAPSVFLFGSSRPVAARSDDLGDRLVRTTRVPLPDPRLVRKIIRQRQLRIRYFDAELFADPAWDMLLDLTAARAEHQRVSITSLCVAAGVPPTTALRWIGQMTEEGHFQRVDDDTDRRRAFVALTDRAAEAMARYFAEAERRAAELA